MPFGGDLRARVVDVVFLAHPVARLGEQIRERVPDDGAARVADVDGAGRVRGHVLDVHGQALAGVAVAVALARPQYRGQDRAERPGAEPQVDEARPGRLGVGDIEAIDALLSPAG